ncbi:ribonuclease H [Senna tora]|uniref:Ribonuclease H n=1 Tax=Senna tora TaxID=362788 RepID=A0A834TRI9_9FABA|nr:ribonuclease H [Senna tora]
MESKSTDSKLWREICNIWPEFYKHVSWEIGCGDRARFWLDKWAPGLESIWHEVVDTDWIPDPTAKISRFVDPFGQWDKERMIDLIPQHIINKILCIFPPNPSLGSDQAVWDPGRNGQFSISNAYNVIVNTVQRHPSGMWKVLWKSKFQQRNKFILWRLGHDRLPTRSRLASWSPTNPSCLWCSRSRETNMHALRDCPKIAAVWRLFLNPRDRALFFNLSAKDWIGWNLQRNKKFASIPWPSIFSAACGLFWHWRNKKLYESDFQFPWEAHRVILIQARLQEEAWRPWEEERISCSGLAKTWRKPMVGWIKVNSDGAVCRSSRRAACGGLIRDNFGNWIKGYAVNLGHASVLSAELWGIVHGLSITWDLGFRKVEIESDSSHAINLIQSPWDVSSNFHPLQQKIACLLSRNWEVKATQISRSANECADTIAKNSLASSTGLTILDVPPCTVASVMMRDLIIYSSRDSGG